MIYSNHRFCRNCYHPLPFQARFCTQCGQRDTDGRISMKSLFQEVWLKIFHLESRFFRILWHLFIPGKVSEEYFRGKQKRYPAPVQFFFVVMFFFLYLFKGHFSANDIKANQTADDTSVGISFDDGGPKRSFSLMEEVKRNFLAANTKVTINGLRLYYDSLPARLHTPIALEAMDTILKKATSHKTLLGDTMKVSLFSEEAQMATTDVFTMEPDQLLDYYRIEGWTRRNMLRQSVRLITHPDQVINAYIGNLAWTIIALVAFMALILKLMYWHPARLYVEHFIFLLHQHSALFLTLTLSFLLIDLGWVNNKIWIPASIWLVLSPLLAMHRFYKQSLGRTIFKWTVFSSIYGISFFVFFALGIIVTFFIF